jgi:hypothetical protein
VTSWSCLLESCCRLGEDTTSQEQTRVKLIQGIEEMRKALAAVPAAPFSAPGPVKQA